MIMALAVAADVQCRHGRHLHVDEIPVQCRRGAPVSQHLSAVTFALRCLRPWQFTVCAESMESRLHW